MSGTQGNQGPNFNLPQSPPDSIPKELKPLFQPIYNTLQNFVNVLIYYAGIAPRPPAAIIASDGDPTSVLANNMGRFYVQATEAILQGAPINLYNFGSICAVRNASSAASRQSDGFCSTTGGIASGVIGEVVLGEGTATVAQVLVPGTRYFLGTGGTYATVGSSAAGTINQSLGVALTSSVLYFRQGQAIQN